MSTTRVPLQSLPVLRNGKTVTPAIGVPFEFTKDEIADIERINPDAVTKQASVDVTTTPSKKSAEKKEDL